MIIGGRRASFLLFVGDLAAFAVSLYVTLWLRYGALPSATTLAPYLVPFTFLFALWALVFYSAGLYGKRLALFHSRLPDAIIKTQIANIIFAAVFFFFIPAFGIAPKTILVLYYGVSLVAILIWRLELYPRISARRVRERAVLVADGPEADELYREVNSNARYGIEFVARTIEARHSALFLVTDDADMKHKKNTVSFEDVYEEVFDRIPLSKLGQRWFLENVSSFDSFFYTFAKRFIDIIGAFVMTVVTVILAPCIALANRFEGSGPLFIAQERFGRHSVSITAYKFRSMQKNVSSSGQWIQEGENKITKVGAFLRRTSLDEFPQFINILRGELSLVGPRNDILGLGRRLALALPYYEARYLVTPGITGWAQINQQYEPGNVSPQSIEETRMRLAYDFYYLKHRSLGLDIMIAVKTVKRMFFRVSSW